MKRTLAIVEREMRRFRRSPMLIVMSMVFPLLQLIVVAATTTAKQKRHWCTTWQAMRTRKKIAERSFPSSPPRRRAFLELTKLQKL